MHLFQSSLWSGYLPEILYNLEACFSQPQDRPRYCARCVDGYCLNKTSSCACRSNVVDALDCYRWSQVIPEFRNRLDHRPRRAGLT